MAKSDLTFKGLVSDIEHTDKPDINLEEKLFADKRMSQVIDEFEQRKGIKPSGAAKVITTVKNIILEPSREHDRDLLNKLMNDRAQYSIIKWSENWSRLGQYKVFIIYEEYTKPDKKPDLSHEQDS